MQPCCSHNIFQALLQTLPLVSILLFGLKDSFKSAAKSAKSLWNQRRAQKQNSESCCINIAKF
jgi:hypothetical protein